METREQAPKICSHKIKAHKRKDNWKPQPPKKGGSKGRQKQQTQLQGTQTKMKNDIAPKVRNAHGKTKIKPSGQREVRKWKIENLQPQKSWSTNGCKNRDKSAAKSETQKRERKSSFRGGGGAVVESKNMPAWRDKLWTLNAASTGAIGYKKEWVMGRGGCIWVKRNSRGEGVWRGGDIWLIVFDFFRLKGRNLGLNKRKWESKNKLSEKMEKWTGNPKEIC